MAFLTDISAGEALQALLKLICFWPGTDPGLALFKQERYVPRYAAEIGGPLNMAESALVLAQGWVVA